MIYKTNNEIEITDINRSNLVTNKAIFKYLEIAFCRHSESLDLNYEKLFKMGYMLVLLEWNLIVIKRPKYGDKIKISTWIEDTKNKVFYRNFKIELNDSSSAIARAKMMIVDLKTLKPVIDNELIKKHKPEDMQVIEDDTRLQELDSYDKKIKFSIRKSDIDINNHVHNLNYLDMIKEIMDDDFEFDNIKIEFQKQIKYDDEVKVLSKKTKNKYYIKIYNNTKLQTSTLIEAF